MAGNILQSPTDTAITPHIPFTDSLVGSTGSPEIASGFPISQISQVPFGNTLDECIQ